MLSQAIEDYLKAIYRLAPNDRVGTVELSKAMNISAASATEMIQRMAKLGLVEYKSHYGAKLTEFGKKAALEVLRSHRLLELFLCETLGYPIEKAHEEACRLEHHISEELEDRIAAALGNPSADPHGHPIPGKQGEVSEIKAINLTNLETGKAVKVAYIEDIDAEALKAIINAGISPKIIISLEPNHANSDKTFLLIDGKEVSLDRSYLTHIFVEMID